MSRQAPIFVISSGRAGSTLLAKMIHRHPRLLCISDIFEPVGEVPYFDRSKVVDGATFFRVLSSPSFDHRISYWRSQPTSELLYLHEDDDMVSLLTSYTLPFLTGGDPMELFEELRSAVEAFEPTTMAGHLICCFDWLRDRFGKELWVERTGGSLPHTEKILQAWPDAKIVHNFRDTRETAISMMTGSFFRLYLELERDPELDEWDWEHMPPRERMGDMLNRWIVNATAALDGFPREQQFDLSYEELMDKPARTLLELAKFLFDREDPASEDVTWAEAEREVIRPAPLRFPGLPELEQHRLQAACEDGLAALGYV